MKFQKILISAKLWNKFQAWRSWILHYSTNAMMRLVKLHQTGLIFLGNSSGKFTNMQFTEHSSDHPNVSDIRDKSYKKLHKSSLSEDECKKFQ